jgi:hypothetical protein
MLYQCSTMPEGNITSQKPRVSPALMVLKPDTLIVAGRVLVVRSSLTRGFLLIAPDRLDGYRGVRHKDIQSRSRSGAPRRGGSRCGIRRRHGISDGPPRTWSGAAGTAGPRPMPGHLLSGRERSGRTSGEMARHPARLWSPMSFQSRESPPRIAPQRSPSGLVARSNFQELQLSPYLWFADMPATLRCADHWIC